MTDPRPFTVGVVACGSAKVNYRAPARHLYVANLFVQTLQAAEAQGFDQVVILSARHGLVDPDTPPDPVQRHDGRS